MKMVVNGVNMEVEPLILVQTIDEPYCHYLFKNSLGKLFDVKARATVQAVRKLPIMGPDGTPGYAVLTHNVQTVVEEHIDDIEGK